MNIIKVSTTCYTFFEMINNLNKFLLAFQIFTTKETQVNKDFFRLKKIIEASIFLCQQLPRHYDTRLVQ